MAIRLTLILIAAIYVVMRFGGGPIENTPAPETASLPDPVVTEPATPSPAPDPAPPVASAPVPDSTRVTLAPPAALAPAVEDETASADTAFGTAQDNLISPLEALPEGFTGGLGQALDLRDQVSAALNEAEESATDRPSLSDLARPGGEQTPVAEAPQPEPDAADLAEVTGSSVNLRGGPSTQNSVVGRVFLGDVVEVRGTFSGGWSAIRHPETGDTAYISSQFLEPLN